LTLSYRRLEPPEKPPFVGVFLVAQTKNKEVLNLYKLSSKQVALLVNSLTNYALSYQCENKEYQNQIMQDAHDLLNSLINQHNQENANLKHYNNYLTR